MCSPGNRELFPITRVVLAKILPLRSFISKDISKLSLKIFGKSIVKLPFNHNRIKTHVRACQALPQMTIALLITRLSWTACGNQNEITLLNSCRLIFTHFSCSRTHLGSLNGKTSVPPFFEKHQNLSVAITAEKENAITSFLR